MNENTTTAATPVHVFVGQGRKVHRAYLAHNGQASTVCGAERRGLGVTYTRRTDAAVTCLACAPSTPAAVTVEQPADVVAEPELVAVDLETVAERMTDEVDARAVRAAAAFAGARAHVSTCPMVDGLGTICTCPPAWQREAAAVGTVPDCTTCDEQPEHPSHGGRDSHAYDVPRISTREDLIARQVAGGVTPERAAMIADARDALQSELTRNAPAIAAALAEPLPGDVPAPIVTVERLVADTLHLGYSTVADYLAAPGREVGQVTPWMLDRAERAFAREVDRRSRVR